MISAELKGSLGRLEPGRGRLSQRRDPQVPFRTAFPGIVNSTVFSNFAKEKVLLVWAAGFERYQAFGVRHAMNADRVCTGKR